MKINEKLLFAAEKNSSKKSLEMPIKEILEEVEKELIVLPQYQTGIRWTIQKSVDLLNYQLLGEAPVSPLSMIEIVDESINEIEQISFITRDKIKGSLAHKKSTTDGQQRISTNLKAYLDDPSFETIVLDLSKGKFIICDNDGRKQYQIPVGKLMNKSLEVFNKYVLANKYLAPYFPTIFTLRSKLLTYNYIINVAQDLTKSQQLEWFEILNNAGSKVPQVQLKLTTLLTEGVDIYTEYTDKFIKILEENNLENLVPVKNTEVSIPIATLNPFVEIALEKEHSLNWSPIPSDAKDNDLCNLEVEVIRSGFEITLRCLTEAIRFIRQNKLIAERIEYVTFLTGFFVYNKDQELTTSQTNKLIEWVKDTDFANKSNSDKRKYFESLIDIRLTN